MRVSTSNSSTTITVSNDLNYQLNAELFYYRGNGTSGYSVSPALTNADYINTDLASHLSLSNLRPGYKMSFMVKVTCGLPVSSLYLTIVNFNPAVNAGIKATRRNITSTPTDIALADAIEIYTACETTTGNPVFGVSDVFDYSPLATKYQLIGETGLNSSTVYLYYTVVFSANMLFTEYADGAATSVLLDTPVASNSEPTRYFYQDSNGTSNCYEGLSFSIPELKVSCEAVS